MDNKGLNKEKILAWLSRHINDWSYYEQAFAIFLNAQESEEGKGGTLTGKGHLTTEFTSAGEGETDNEITKRMWWEYEDYVGKLGVGAIPFITWLDKEDK